MIRYSTFKWPRRGASPAKRGWIIGPFLGRTITITVETGGKW